VRGLAARFVPAADEVWYLQHSKGPEGEFFRSFSEKGHYGGRTTPTDTRQGVYCVAPSGAFLASMNHNDPRRVEGMLRAALEAWEKLSREERLGGAPPGDGERPRERLEARRPEGGLVLSVVTRDLPRAAGEKEPRDWRAASWNRDAAWFTAEEAASLVPAEARAGAAVEWPARPARRFARCHLVDIVRGQSPAMGDGAVRTARIVSTVVSAEGARVALRLEGTLDLLEKGRWAVEGFADMRRPSEQERGFRGRLLGTATWDREARRFVAFEAVVAGDRRGATQYNGRSDDPGPAPQGFVLSLEKADAPVVAPACFWAYGW